jgi:uncharacterized protein (DUF2147 family)
MKPLKYLFSTFLIAIFSILLNSTASAQSADDIVGVWLTGSKKGHVEIYKQNDKYYGKIVWLEEPNNEQGKPKTDKNNPDESKRNRPLIGLVNLRDFKYKGKNTWEDGRIYDPEKGKDYSCIMTLKDKNTLDVRGYVGISMIGRTDTWSRIK